MRPHPRPTRYNRYSLPSRMVRWGALALGLAVGLPIARAQVPVSLSVGNPRRSPIVEVVDPDNGNILHVLPGGPRDIAWATTDPNRLITFFDDNTIGWYDLSTGARVGKGVNLGFELWGLVSKIGRASCRERV